jgi:periplasmic divalent cation tolerance protein
LSAEPAALLVTTTLATEAEALAMAEALVTERLAACVHVAGPVNSTYRWQGQVERSTEWTCQAKTSPARGDALMARIRALHGYEVPEIVAMPAIALDPDYLRWLAESTTEPA